MFIGQIEIPHGLFLAPMAGYTDSAMRRICLLHGAEYVTTEMISAKAICYNDQKTITLAKIHDDESPCALQLFGHEVDILGEAAQIIYEKLEIKPCAIDINMGCPVPKIVGNGEGSALMKTPFLIEQLVKSVVLHVPCPVTVKIRAGWDYEHRNAVECAKAAEAGGASAIFVHGRTRSQQYSGTADYTIIQDVVKALQIPVIGNGDVTNCESAKRLLDETGCAGIMIGRAAVGNPFLFESIKEMLDGKTPTPISFEERKQAALLQLRMAIEDKGEDVAVRESRKQFGGAIKGLRDAAKARFALCTATTYQEVESILSSIKEE